MPQDWRDLLESAETVSKWVLWEAAFEAMVEPLPSGLLHRSCRMQLGLLPVQPGHLLSAHSEAQHVPLRLASQDSPSQGDMHGRAVQSSSPQASPK